MRLVHIIRAFDDCVDIRALEEESGFSKGMEDEDWIGKISQWIPKPIALCGDGRILKSPAKLAALKEANTHFVVMADGFPCLPWNQMVIKVLQGWEGICHAVAKEVEKTVFRFRANGGIEIWRRLSDFKAHADLHKKGATGA